MITDQVISRKKTLFKFLVVIVLAFSCAAVYGQTTVDCSLATNCTNEYCNYPKETAPGLRNGIERGCNCFNNYDDDGDGLTDKQDLECAQYYGLQFVGPDGNCSLLAPTGNPFTSMAAPIVSGQNTADTQSKVSVGDLDYDGVPDVVITSKWNSEIRVVATKAHTVGGVTYAPGDIKSDYKTTGQGAKIFSGTDGCDPKNLLFEHENLIANIDDAGPAELFAIVSNRGGNPSTPPTCFFLLSLRYAAGDLVPMYDAVALGPDRPGVFGVADMDGDGKAEIYMRDRIYAAETGKLLATGNGDWDLDITSGPVAVDVIKGDNGRMELVCGTKIFTIPNLTNRNPATPANLTLARDMNTLTNDKCFVKLSIDIVEYGTDTHSMCSVADIDGDGNLDVIISGALNGPLGKTAIFYWNVTKNLVSHFIVPDASDPNGWSWGTGRVNLLDSDDDGFLDLFFVAGSTLFRVETAGAAGTFPADINTNAATYGAFVTTRAINDSRSGVLTVTIYDFDNNGKFELVYRDSQELVVVDAVSLGGPNSSPAPAKYWSATCQSHTYTEGPIIADVNGDGATDICVACNRNNSFDINQPIQQQALGEVRLFFSQNNSWLPTRKVWNQPGYFVVNINDDLSLPFPQYEQTLTFGTGTCSNGLVGPQRPLNVYLNQLPYITASGCPVFPSPDLTYFGDDPNQPGVDTNNDGVVNPSITVDPIICGNTQLNVRFNLINSGLLPISSTVPVAFYNGDPRLGPAQSTFLYTTTLNISLPVGVTSSRVVTFPGPGSQFELFIVLNNTGFPVTASGIGTNDCNLENNIARITVVPTPFNLTAALVKPNQVCLPTDANGEVRVEQVLRGTTVVTDWTPYDFQWHNGPAVGPYTARPGDTGINLTGLVAGTYTVTSRHRTFNCNSLPADVVVTESPLAASFTLTGTDQTTCTPLNGSVTANFNGADLTGVSLVWQDANSGTQIATGVTSITGLKGAVTYQLTSTKGACSFSQTVSLTSPPIPSGLALPERDVMSCLNPQSGKVSARAYLEDFSGLDPDTTRYRFTWYNFQNGTRGSLLPVQPANGPSVSGLGVGFYEVTLTDKLTNCSSIDPIAAVEVKEGFTIPTAVVNRVRPQTSCDPLNGNAALQGVALVAGVPATQTDYDFFWYEGQNTLTRLRDNSNTVINNSTLDNVQGGVRGGGLAYTVEVVHRATGCAATAFNTAEEIINYPVVNLAKTDNDICPNGLNLAFTGSVTSTVTFAAQPVTDFAAYSINWYTGTTVLEANRIPNSSALTQLQNRQGGQVTLQVEQTALKCMSQPVTIQILDLLAYPQLTPSATPSTTCTNPPLPDGRAAVATVDGQAVPATGILLPYTFRWFTGSAATPGNEFPGTNNLGFIANLAGSNDPSAANYTVAVTNAKGCSSNMVLHIPDNRVIPNLSLAPTPNTICAEGNNVVFNGRVDATITNQNGALTDYQFTWTNVTAGVTRTDLTTSWANISGATYRASVRHVPTGCESPLATATVTNVTTLPVIDAIGIGSTNCAPARPGNGSAKVISLNGTPTETAGVPDAALLNQYNIQWFQGGTATGTPVATVYNTPSNIQGAANANYTTQVRRLSDNCTSTFTVIVPDRSALPLVTIAQDPNLNCEGFNGAAFITQVTHQDRDGVVQTIFDGTTPNANLQYNWFNGQGTATPVAPQINNPRRSNLEGGLFYSATVTMIAEGCTSSFAAIEVQNNLVFPDPVTVVNGSQNCDGGTPNGSADVSVVAPGTYAYSWYQGATTGATGTEINDNANDTNIAGIQGAADAFYTVAVRNTVTGCTGTETVVIPDISQIPLINPLTAITNKKCAPFGPDGAVNFNGITYRGAVVPAPYTGFTFAWTSASSGALTETTPSLANRATDEYTLTVTHVAHNCISEPIDAVVLNELVYPDINTITTPQTSCDNTAPNGQLVANVNPGNVTAGYSFEWTGPLGIVSETATDGTTTRTLPSANYSVTVQNTTNGCVSSQAVFLPNVITYPTLAYSNVAPNSRCDTPNGAVTPVVTGLSSAGGVAENFSIYFVKTIEGSSYPTDKTVIENTTVPAGGQVFTSNSGIPVPFPPVTGLRPGFVTGFVRDHITACESSVETVEITDATELVTYQFVDDVHAGLCELVTNPGGGIDVTITGGSGGTLVFEWFKGTPLNTNINFYDNPPDMGGLPRVNTNTSSPDLGMPSGNPAGGVGAGVYTLIVSDLGNGCGAFFIESVPISQSPTFNVTGIDNTRCTNPNGALQVEVIRIDPTSGPYSITFFNGNGPTGTVVAGSEICGNGIDDDGDGLVDDADNTCGEININATLNNLPEGEYFVQLRDAAPQNVPCPLGKGIVLNRRAFDPLLNAELFKANTSCDPDDSGDGTIRLTATPNSNTDPLLPTGYEVYDINPDPLGFLAGATLALTPGVQSGDITGFGPNTYTILMRDNLTGCQASTSIAIPDRPQVPDGLDVVPTPETFCFPNSNGALTVSLVSPGAVADYEYEWSDNITFATTLHTGAETVYDASLPGWKSVGNDGFGNGDQAYFIRGKKIAGDGVGCYTPVIQRVVEDQHRTPVAAIATRPNTSCLPTIGEGYIEITASTTSSDPLVQNAAYTYTLDGLLPVNAQNGATPYRYPDLTDKNGTAYQVVATNEVSGCITQRSIVISDSKFAFAITNNTVIHQLICDPYGNIAVTEIQLNRELTNETGITYNTNLSNDFVFSWRRGTTGPLADNGNTTITGETLATGTAAGQYPTMGAGTYFVTATRNATVPGAGCATPPYRVDVLDQHRNPLVALTPFSNTSCDNAIFEGAIRINVTDASMVNSPFTYAYTWTGALPGPTTGNDGDGVSTDNDGDHPQGLRDGVYGLTVENEQTGCSASASTTILKNETPVFLTEAVSLPRQLCSPDGSIEVTEVQVQYQDPVIGVQNAPLGDFTYSWERGNTGIVLNPAGLLLNSATYAAVREGTYFVRATRTLTTDGGPGLGCSSAPLRVEILDRRNYPNVTVIPDANTACSADADFFEGSTVFNITETGVGSGAQYTYSWTAADPTNTTNVLTQVPLPSGPGTADIQTGLRDDEYTITVTNQTTQCSVTVNTEIIKTTIPVIIASADTSPKLICNASGSAFVTRVDVDGVAEDPSLFSNFNFTWSEGTLGNVIGTLPDQGQGISNLNPTTYTSITENGTLTYHVSVYRREDAINLDGTPAKGRGCVSPPVTVTITDVSVDPLVSFATTQNTSCNDLAPNGTLTATASDPDGQPYTYTFLWTPPASPAPPTPFSNGAQNGFTRAAEGVYALTLTNNDTGCDIQQSFEVELNERASYPNIIEVLPTSPVDCNNSGSAVVTRIYIGNEQNAEIPGTDARFTYTWYTAYTSPAANTPIAGQTEEVIGNRGPGTYFVTVMDTFEDRNCPSGPNQVVIDDPIENYPVIYIGQSLPQISCRPGEGTAQLEASADNSQTAAPYTFTWYNGLDAQGTPLVSTGPTGNILGGVANGSYSVRVYNSVTNCESQEYFIVEDERDLFYPMLSVQTFARTNCVTPNAALNLREVGYDQMNTTIPTAPFYYRFAPNFTADYILGPLSATNPAFDNPMTMDAAFNQLTNRLWNAGLLDAGDTYTVKITDENTGCVTLEEIVIPDARRNPDVTLMTENPLINCFEALPNGQIVATVDNNPVTTGYTFDWYRGEQVDPARVITPTNGYKLIGVGQTPDNTALRFTVRVTDNDTQCFADATTTLTDGRLDAEQPVAFTVQDDSRCDSDDGWVSATVNDVIFNHNFFWFNGEVNNPNPAVANHLLANYTDRGEGWYTVVAQDRVTGCFSPPAKTFVEDISVIPQLIFKTTASYCEDVPLEIGGGKGNGTIELTLDPADVISDDIRWVREETLTDAGTGNYVTGLFPGWYGVDVLTTKGCAQTGRVEVPTDIRNYNLITQNSDNKNDKFVIDCISRFPNNNVKIFNRSGVLVYEATNYNNDDVVFDGIGKNGIYMTGNVLPVGTYFYIIDKRDGSKPRTGYLELVR